MSLLFRVTAKFRRKYRTLLCTCILYMYIVYILAVITVIPVPCYGAGAGSGGAGVGDTSIALLELNTAGVGNISNNHTHQHHSHNHGHHVYQQQQQQQQQEHHNSISTTGISVGADVDVDVHNEDNCGHCHTGKCVNQTCLCDEGWQGSRCQYCAGKIRLTEPTGFIHDGPGNYSIGVKCSWLIDAGRTPGSNTTIRLHIQEFATECGWDHLYVYDGDSVDSPLLAVFSGLMYKDAYAVRSVPELMTRSGSALLHFFSDDAYNMSGFNISYAVNACPSKYSHLNCSGHGVCKNSICTCHHSWSGKACDQPKCPNNCSASLQQGECNTFTQSCSCRNGYSGEDCSQNVKYGVWETVIPDRFVAAGSASHGAVVWRDSLYIVGGEGYGRSHLMYTYDFNGGVWETPHSLSSVVPLPRYGASAVLHGDKIFLYGGVVTEHLQRNNVQRHHSKYRHTQHTGPSHFRDSAGHLSHALPSSQDGTGTGQDKDSFHEYTGSAITRVTNELWAFDISTNTWENITVRTPPCNSSHVMCGPLRSAGHTGTIVTLQDTSSQRKTIDKMIVIFGHSPQFGYLNTVQEYNFGTREWWVVRTRGYPAKGGYGHSAAYDTLSHCIYVYGGIVSESESNQVLNSNLYSYDPATRIWTLLAHAPSARFLHTANFILPGLMMVFGGNTHNDTSHSFGAKCYSNELLAYDAVCDTWHQMDIPGHLRDNLARYGHSGTVFEGSLHIFGGFDGQMLNDMVRFTPGQCHLLTNKTECLSSRIGVKCVWDISLDTCLNLTQVGKDYKYSLDEEFGYNKCPKESRDRMTQRTFYHKDRCSLQTDCTSCVQTSYGCFWCPSGMCTNQRCSNSNYQATSHRKLVTILGDCPVESGPACAQLHSCHACVGAHTYPHGHMHMHNVPQHNHLQDVHAKPLLGGVTVTSFLPHLQCYWDYEAAKCTQGNSSNTVESSDNGSVSLCTSSCSELTSCTNCTQEECIWCQNEARCVDKNAYTASFPYGQCREWTTVIGRCRSPPSIDVGVVSEQPGISSCSAYASCSSCREEPSCGWCDDGSNTGLGVCLPGGASKPASPHSCPASNWHFTHCPDCQCNGHSTCVENSSLCIQPCGNLTTGAHCDKCSPGYWGNPLNGGRCQPCECNDQATLCHPESGKCFCTTKGLAGDHCEKCDGVNHYHPDPSIKGSCYYDLAIDYQFTFNLSKKEDRHFTQINFRNTPVKPDIDADFSITCSVLAKMNITIRTAFGQEKSVFHSINCTTFRYRFAKADHNFGMEDNVNLTTFYVYVYDFQPPLWIQISFSQYPKLNLQQFFITFSSCFLLLLLVAALLWKIKQKYDMYRRRQRFFVEMEQMASRPFSQVLVEIENREQRAENQQNHMVANPLQQVESPVNIQSIILPTGRKKKKDSPSPIALEPCSGNKAAVLSLLVRLPTGGGNYTPPGQAAGLAVASALVTLGSPPRHAHAPDPRLTDSKITKRGKGGSGQHPDTCI